MTQVDFYVLDDSAPRARLLFAVKFIEKLFRNKMAVHVNAADQAQLRQLDELLWTARDISFVPHEISTAPLADCPVTLNMGNFDGHDGVLINLASEVPEWFSRFERVVEIINKQDPDVAAGRARYRFYKDRGYPLVNHTMGVNR